MVKVYFIDTSALVKRYIQEIGSNWICNITDSNSNNTIIISRITWVELISALSRLQRENRIQLIDMSSTIQIFRYDWEITYQVVEVEQNLVEDAGKLVQKYPLRAYDSIQLASALKIYPSFVSIDPNIFTFISSDNRLLDAAQNEGLVVDNPNNYQN